jgi:GT2 family glycosyltransferase
MDLTFGIVTKYDDNNRLLEIINSIKNLHIKNYEIIFIGDGITSENIIGENIKHIKFDETIKQGWITKKKNIIAKSAKYEIIVMMHDYHVFDKDWYEKFLIFGDNWDICCTSQIMIDGRRNFVDWALWDKPGFGKGQTWDYNDWNETKYMYISGAFFLVKKYVLLNEPFNESLTWNQSEDVEWSLRVREKYKIVCNGSSVVRHNKSHRHNYM